jgi:hypothetical protein
MSDKQNKQGIFAVHCNKDLSSQISLIIGKDKSNSLPSYKKSHWLRYSRPPPSLSSPSHRGGGGCTYFSA